MIYGSPTPQQYWKLQMTAVKQKDSRKWMSMAPDGKYTNMKIDLMLADTRWKAAVRVCRTFQWVDISSDHSLVMCTLQLAKTKREIKYARQESAEIISEKEYRKLCAVVWKAARTHKEEWLQGNVRILKGLQEIIEAYRLVKQINRSWKPKPSRPIMARWLTTLQRRSQKRRTEYCSSLYTDSGLSDTVIPELDHISPPPSEDEIHDILFEQVEAAVKRLRKAKAQ
jgi:hypothetical protein